MKKSGLAKFSSLVLAAVMMLSLLAGCGGNDGNAGNDGGGGDGAGASKVVNLAISENLTNLDPHNASSLPCQIAESFVFEPLINTDHENSFYPWLAESWEMSDDGLEWTLKLRHDVMFHNGEAFNADDVVATFQRLIDKRDELYASIQYWDTLAGVEKIDEYTVKIILSAPIATALISFANTPIIPDEAYAEYGDALWNDQIMYGTGPWVFDEWVDGQYCHYLKNDNYWNKDTYDSYYDEVYMRTILEASTAVAAQLAGDIDAYIASGGINNDMLPLYDGTDDRIELVKLQTGGYQYIGLSMKEGHVFTDKNVRLAMAHAIDYQSIVDNVIGGGKVPASVITDTCLGYDESLHNYEYDPELAKEYLDKSSYNGEPLVLASNTSTLKAEEIMLAISEMMNNVGFNTSVNIVESAALLEMRNTGDYDAFMVTNMHANNDPALMLTQRILNDSHHSFYKNEEMFDLIRQSNAEVDSEKREQEITQIAKMIEEDVAPQIAISQLEYVEAINYGVTGIEIFTDGQFRICYVDYDPALAK